MIIRGYFCLIFLTFFVVPIFAESCKKYDKIFMQTQNIMECIKPECFPNEGFQDKSKTPEEVIQKKMEAISSEEAIYRLIFSEMLASYCTDFLSDEKISLIGQGIAAVISQRVKNYKINQEDSAKENKVVFEKAQFRSSTGGCDVAKRAEFLCPTKNPQWEKLWRVAQESWREVKKKNPLKGAAKFYYFPKHFINSKDCAKYNGAEVFHTWKKGKVEVQLLSESKEVSECVKFFK